jgi:hypothetical protein
MKQPQITDNDDDEICERCDSSKEVEGGLCAECFENAPVGVWF